MGQGVLERILGPDAFDAPYERITVAHYTRELSFSTVFGLVSLVVCRMQPGICAAYQDDKVESPTLLTAVYAKRSGIDKQSSQALVSETAAQTGGAIHGLKGIRTPWLADDRVTVLDGNRGLRLLPGAPSGGYLRWHFYRDP